MPRNRTLRASFPRSRSMQKISRDARLAFALLWTIADDEGRLIYNPESIARRLFPGDEDALSLMPEWLHQLEQVSSIRLYEIGGVSFIQIINWEQYQSVDKPKPSELPAIQETKVQVRKRQVAEVIKPEPEVPILLEIPCVGMGPKTYPITQAFVDDLSAAYPAVDVLAECRKALMWSKANPKMQKTHAGMARFLNQWMSRAQDRGPSVPLPRANGHARQSADEGYGQTLTARFKEKAHAAAGGEDLF